jgi:putative addiction module component (TIGR02574 family)
MIDLHIKIQDEQYDFFMQVVNNFDFVEVDNAFELSEEKKAELDRRYNAIEKGEEETVSYDEFKKLF